MPLRDCCSFFPAALSGYELGCAGMPHVATFDSIADSITGRTMRIASGVILDQHGMLALL